MKRRAFITTLGLGVGLATTRGYDEWKHTQLPVTFSEVLAALDATLSPEQRALTILPMDHPTRQVTNTINIYQSPHIGTLYDPHQIALIRRLYQTMLAEQGQRWMHNTTSLEGKFEGSALKIYARDSSANLSPTNSQVVLNGGHFMLRSAGLDQASDDAYVFGGPIAYGQQLGNGRYQVQGNAFKAHGDAMHAFHQSLSSTERSRAYLTAPPLELVTQIQGKHGRFPGIRIGDTSSASQELAANLVATILSAYPTNQRQDALNAIEQFGGLAELHVAMYVDFGFYPDGGRFDQLSPSQQQDRGIPYAQVWRIEGPNCVIHFKGYPHVHAYINIVRDPQRAAIGEALSTTQNGLNTAQVRRFMHDSIHWATKAEFVYYPDWILGRLAPGTVSTGSLSALDPYSNRIATARVNVASMSEALKQSLRKQGAQLTTADSFVVVTIDYMASRPDLFGLVEQLDLLPITMFDAMTQFATDANLDARYG